ncbi:MAG: hypothetical protein LBS21_05125 [Clostridiales bacterium]|jgi:hypothetical protein|nr:hypothetical protein [Clostridiales bacterium]
MGVAYWDLLVLLGKHLCEIATEINCNLPADLLDNLNNFWKDEEITETKNKSANLAVMGKISSETPKILQIISMFAGLSSELRFGSDKKEILREKIKKSTAQWIGYIREISDYISDSLGGKQPIIIFEDLDKLTPDKAWEIFNNPLSQMPFPVIFTFPISLSYDTKFAALEASFSNNVQILPLIKIRSADGADFVNGIDAIKDIIDKRADLSLFEGESLIFMIKKTGGILRDLFNCITNAANRAENRNSAKIEMEDAIAAAIKLSSSLTRRIESRNYPLLRNIYKGGKYKKQIEDRKMLLDMMQGLIVLEYNAERWHDLHPLV